MQSTYRLLTTTLFTLVLSCTAACTATHQFAVAEFDTNQLPMPALGLFRGHRDPKLRDECAADNQGLLRHCGFDFIDLRRLAAAFVETQQYEAVRIERKYPPIHLYLTQVVRTTESAKSLSNAVASGATLLLLPMNTNAELAVVATVSFESERIAQFEYRIPFVESVHWFNRKDIRSDLARSIASHVVADMQKLDLPRLQVNQTKPASNEWESR